MDSRQPTSQIERKRDMILCSCEKGWAARKHSRPILGRLLGGILLREIDITTPARWPGMWIWNIDAQSVESFAAGKPRGYAFPRSYRSDRTCDFARFDDRADLAVCKGESRHPRRDASSGTVPQSPNRNCP
jgi:hypothetical protein